MSKENLILNLQVLAATLEVAPPVLSKDNTFVLELNYRQKIYFEYHEKIDQLYLYMPISDELPKNSRKKSELCQLLLEDALHVVSPEIGTIGFDKENGEIIFYNRVVIGDLNEIYLAVFVPAFIEAAMDWCEVVDKEIAHVHKKGKILVGVIQENETNQ